MALYRSPGHPYCGIVTPQTLRTSASPIPGSAPGAHKVVVGIDGSPPSRAALEYAAEEASLLQADLEVVMAWDWPMAYARTPLFHESDPVGGERKDFEAAVARILKSHPEVAVTTVFTQGHPAKTLVEASKGADLLVVGSRGYGAFVGMLLGSVSQHCATHAHCPVFIHRAPD